MILALNIGPSSGICAVLGGAWVRGVIDNILKKTEIIDYSHFRYLNDHVDSVN